MSPEDVGRYGGLRREVDARWIAPMCLTTSREWWGSIAAETGTIFVRTNDLVAVAMDQQPLLTTGSARDENKYSCVLIRYQAKCDERARIKKEVVVAEEGRVKRRNEPGCLLYT